MPKISVLIPVYNASEFLYDSIPSILNQTFSNIELVCVNDGSKDNSLEILNEFKAKDSRVKVIDKENGGCGSARNRALDEATGEYVYFFDPDDMLEENAFELAYTSASKNDSDMVVFKANVFDEKGISNRETFFYYDVRLDESQFDNFTYHDLKEFVLRGGYAPWAKLYKKEFLDAYDDFKFNLGLAFDDVPFHVKSMIRAKRISFINEYLYHYKVDNVNSVNSTASNGFDIFKIIDIVEDIIKGENCYDEMVKQFHNFKVGHILLYIISTDSAEYFRMARERFMELDEKYIADNSYLKTRYDLVLKHDDYDTFKMEYNILTLESEKNQLSQEVKKLKKQNRKLKKELKKLKKESQNSQDSKFTKALGKFKR